MWCEKNKLFSIIGLVSLIIGFCFLSFFSTANAVLAKEVEKYEITEGDGDVYTKGVDEYLRFSGSGEDFDFTGLEIDSLSVDPVNYELTGYSATNITLSKGFLDTLSEGLHDITMQWNDGIATGKFIVAFSAASAYPDQPENNLNDENKIYIDEINITVNPPKIGKPMDFEILNYSSKPENAFKGFEVVWYKVEEGKRRKRYYPGAVFEPGVTYMVAVRADYDKDQFVISSKTTFLKVNGQLANEQFSQIDPYYNYVGIAYIWEPLAAAADNDPGNEDAGSTGNNVSPATGISTSNDALSIAFGCVGLAMIACFVLCSRKEK